MQLRMRLIIDLFLEFTLNWVSKLVYKSRFEVSTSPFLINVRCAAQGVLIKVVSAW